MITSCPRGVLGLALVLLVASCGDDRLLMRQTEQPPNQIETLEPAAQVIPAAWTFGSVEVGDSATKQFVLSNTGQLDWTLFDASFTGTSGAYTVNLPNATTVAVGSSLTFSVEFAPTAEETFSDTLMLSFEPGPTPFDVPLEGEGSLPVQCTDLDGDTYGPGCAPGPDCDDSSPSIHPGAEEVCDAVDNDCDAEIDEEEVCGPCRIVLQEAGEYTLTLDWFDAAAKLTLWQTAPIEQQLEVFNGSASNVAMPLGPLSAGQCVTFGHWTEHSWCDNEPDGRCGPFSSDNPDVYGITQIDASTWEIQLDDGLFIGSDYDDGFLRLHKTQ